MLACWLCSVSMASCPTCIRTTCSRSDVPNRNATTRKSLVTGWPGCTSSIWSRRRACWRVLVPISACRDYFPPLPSGPCRVSSACCRTARKNRPTIWCATWCCAPLPGRSNGPGGAPWSAIAKVWSTKGISPTRRWSALPTMPGCAVNWPTCACVRRYEHWVLLPS